MTERSSPTAPALWNLWDSFGIEQCEMIGWWEDDAPASASSVSSSEKCSPSDFAVTTFFKYGSRALLVVSSFCHDDDAVVLSVDWDTIGLEKPKISQPAIKGVQDESANINVSYIELKANAG